MSKTIDIIKDIVEKIIGLRDQIKNELYFDLLIKVDGGHVKFVTVTLKKMYSTDK